MPIYEYQCPQCGHVFEEWVKASESLGEEPCPKCGTIAPRVMSQTSFVLKGGGWYVSDYGYRKGVKEDGADPAPAKTDGASTTETATPPSKAGTSDNAPAAASSKAAPSQTAAPKAAETSKATKA